MSIFKYTVANKSGKQLSGNIEATTEENARNELNNLGFSILTLEQGSENELPKIDNLQKFIFEAIDKSNRSISGTIPAENSEAALDRLFSEYELSVTAIWPENASETEIEKARREGTQRLSAKLEEIKNTEQNAQKIRSQEERNEETIVRTRIDYTLKRIHELLENLSEKINPEKRNEIEKKIDKLLRIKSSTNLDYILATAKDILESIQKEEDTLKQKGFEDQRIKLKLQTKELLSDLNRNTESKTLSQDIVQKIDSWQKKHASENPEGLINRSFHSIKKLFTTPPEIETIKNQIKTYNRQFFEFIRLYFQESSPEYRQKIKNSIKTLISARGKAKRTLKKLRALRREQRKNSSDQKSGMLISLTEELNALSGWLLVFYISYYFISLYLSSKDFGLQNVPNEFIIYDTTIFKYVVAILFILHSVTALKVNFFRKSILANIILPPTFVFLSIIVLINF